MTRHAAKFASTRIEAERGDDWRDYGLCRDKDPEGWFPVGTSGPALRQAEEAKATCRRCPVQNDCLVWALDNAPFGIFGGFTEDERRDLSGSAS